MAPVPPSLAAQIVGHMRGYAIVGLTAEGVITHWLGDAESITGYSESEVLGQNFRFLFTASDQAQNVHVEELSAALARGMNEDSRWHRRKGGELFWGNGLTMPLGHGDAVLMKIFRDETPLKRAEERRLLLLNELNHRVRNTLATVQSVTEQTLRGSGVASEVRSALGDRLMALSRTHDVLVDQNWAGADFRTLVQQATIPYERDPSPFSIAGPLVRLHPSQAVTLSLVLHELATNAVKHGALSNPGGMVEISWNIGLDAQGKRAITLLWRERGGPRVSAPTHRGFGTRLISSALSGDRGQTQIDYNPDGLQASLSLVLIDANDEPAAEAGLS